MNDHEWHQGANLPSGGDTTLSGGTQSDMLRYVVHGWGKGSLLRWGRISLKTVGRAVGISRAVTQTSGGLAKP